MHLIFWGLSNIFSYGFLICQSTYTHTQDDKWFEAGEWFHIAVMIDTTFLQTYLAYIIFKLSLPNDMTNIIRQIKAGHARNNHSKFKKLDYQYQGSEGEEIMESFKTQAELDVIYQNARLSKSPYSSELIDVEFSERIFSNFIKQVANETNK